MLLVELGSEACFRQVGPMNIRSEVMLLVGIALAPQVTVAVLKLAGMHYSFRLLPKMGEPRNRGLTLVRVGTCVVLYGLTRLVLWHPDITRSYGRVILVPNFEVSPRQVLLLLLQNVNAGGLLRRLTHPRKTVGLLKLV